MNQRLYEFALQYMPAIYRRIIATLESGEYTTNELAEINHCNSEAARSAVKALHLKKIIHIAGWRRNLAGPPYTVWGLGDLPNVKRPTKMTPSERSKRWRIKKQSANQNMWGIAA